MKSPCLPHSSIGIWVVVLSALTCAPTAAAETPWNFGPVHADASYQVVVRVDNQCSWTQSFTFTVLPGSSSLFTPQPLGTLVDYLAKANGLTEKVIPVSGPLGWLGQRTGSVLLGSWSGALATFEHDQSVVGDATCLEEKQDLRIELAASQAAKPAGIKQITTPTFVLRQRGAREPERRPPPKAPENPAPSPSPEVDAALEIPTISVPNPGPPTTGDPPADPASPQPPRIPGGPPGPQVKPVSWSDDLDTFGGLSDDGAPFEGLAMDSGPVDLQWQNLILDLSSLSVRIDDNAPPERAERRLAAFGLLRSFLRMPPAQLALGRAAIGWPPEPLRPGPALPAPAGQAGRVLLSLIATGASTGEVFQLQVLNGSGRPLRVGGPDGLVVQAIRNAKPMTALSPSRVQKQPVLGFCLDFARHPPPPGTVYQIASRELQKQFRPLREVFRAAQRLADQGMLHPDGDPRKYVDFVKQWSLWTKREGWESRQFESHFLERTRTNLLQLGRKWTPDTEKAVRVAVPGRWRDVQAVLKEVRG